MKMQPYDWPKAIQNCLQYIDDNKDFEDIATYKKIAKAKEMIESYNAGNRRSSLYEMMINVGGINSEI